MKKIAIMMVLPLFLISCESLPKRASKTNNIIGINIGHTGLLPFPLTKVFFTKLEKKSDIHSGKELVATNQSRRMDHYLFDVEAGTYAAVGGVYTITTNIGYISIYHTYVLFFPESMVKKTIVTVKKNEIAFMGRYLVSKPMFLKPAAKSGDSVQKHYSASDTGYKKVAQVSTAAVTSKNGKDKLNFKKRTLKMLKKSDWESLNFN